MACILPIKSCKKVVNRVVRVFFTTLITASVVTSFIMLYNTIDRVGGDISCPSKILKIVIFL